MRRGSEIESEPANIAKILGVWRLKSLYDWRCSYLELIFNHLSILRLRGEQSWKLWLFNAQKDVDEMSSEMSFLSPMYLEAITDRNGKIFQMWKDQTDLWNILKSFENMQRMMIENLFVSPFNRNSVLISWCCCMLKYMSSQPVNVYIGV